MHSILYLVQKRDADEIEKALGEVKWTTGDTYTNLALEELLNHGFTSASGARSSVPHVAIVITDGWSKKPQDTMEKAKQAKDQGIIMFSIGTYITLNGHMKFAFVITFPL